MNKAKQMSETMRIGSLLAISGGLMDAYSYIYRDHVFANAQTGNILLFGVNLSEGNFSEALRYFLPIVSFIIGIALAEVVRYKEGKRLHWRQTAVLFEAVILAIVAFMPTSCNMAANSLISFACGIQVESFRKIRGNAIATTMCIGNTRSGTQNLCMYFQTKEHEYLHKAWLYYEIILFFVLGAVTGNFCIGLLGGKAILCSSVLLIAAFIWMFIDYEKDERMTEVVSEKNAIRAQLKAVTRSLSKEYKREASESITRQCIESDEYKRAGSIFIYISMDGEPDTTGIIMQALVDGKKVYVPRCLKDGIMEAVRIDSMDALKPGHYGILEPDESIKATPTDEFDSDDTVAFVPCVGATKDGRRIGHGAGYYDRFLEQRRMKKLMLVYGQQLVSELPCDEHDIIMDKVICEDK